MVHEIYTIDETEPFKTSFGSKFLSRHDQNMTKEMSIKCHLLNKMFEIGKPISVPVG
ncbi:hypothetical protein [Rickettsia endosymbiont of Urophora cardui]|uniref:hypothetical protein n=1 Tax=Rickettsia endosymbiont of Urophora cardui TaxID=3066265 RepID=UPI00313B1358